MSSINNKKCVEKQTLNAKQTKRREYYKKLLQRAEPRKPQICKYFIHGSCKLVDCGFSHDVTPDQMKKFNEPCKYYRIGECSKDKMCCFMHGDFPCQFFHNKTGNRCKKGEKCLFSHKPLTEETTNALKKFLEAQENRSQILLAEEPVIQSIIQSDFGKSILCSNNTNVQTNILNFGRNTLAVSESLDYEEENSEKLILSDIETNDDTESLMEKNMSTNLTYSSPFSRLFVSRFKGDSESDNNEITVNDPLNIKENSESEIQAPEKTLNTSLFEKNTSFGDHASLLDNVPTFTRFSDDSDSDVDLQICEDFSLSGSKNIENLTIRHLDISSKQCNVIQISNQTYISNPNGLSSQSLDSICQVGISSDQTQPLIHQDNFKQSTFNPIESTTDSVNGTQNCKSRNVDMRCEIEVETSTPISNNCSSDPSPNFIGEFPHESSLKAIPQKLSKPRKRKDKLESSIMDSVSNDENNIIEIERLHANGNLSNDIPISKKIKQMSKTLGLKEHCSNKDNTIGKCKLTISEEKHNNFENSCDFTPIDLEFFDFTLDNSLRPEVELVSSDSESEINLVTIESYQKYVDEPKNQQKICDIKSIPFHVDLCPELPSVMLFDCSAKTPETLKNICPYQETTQLSLNIQNSLKAEPFPPPDIPHILPAESTPEVATLISSNDCLSSDSQTRISLTNFSPVLMLPENVGYNELDIKCYNWNHKFDDPRIRNHPNALKPNLFEWFFN